MPVSKPFKKFLKTRGYEIIDVLQDGTVVQTIAM